MSQINFRDSQSYVLGAPSITGSGNLNFTAARSIMLGRLALTSSSLVGGLLVDGITVQGQSVFASNQSAPLLAFHPSNQTDGANYLGIPLVSNGVAQVSITAAPGSIINAGIYADPWDEAKLGPVPSPDSMGASALNFVCGLGSTNIGIGASGQLSCTVLRDIQAGELVVVCQDSVTGNFVADAQITSIKVNQTEQLCSTDPIGVGLFAVDAVDHDMRTLAQVIPMNSTITIGFTNQHTAAVDIAALFFCLAHG